MYTKQDLINDLIKIGVKKNDTLLVHSSMKSIGEVVGGADTVLDAFIDYLEDGLLIFPTHSWMTMKDDHLRFDRKTEPSCVGLLTNMFMKRPEVYRSYHPTHSVAAKGKDALSYIAGEEKITTPCGRQGCYGKLVDRKAKILFLGCSLSKNTFIHGVEEWADVKGRLMTEVTKYEIITDEGIVINNMLRHGAKIEPSQYYDKMEPVFMEKGVATKGKIGDATSYLCDAVGVCETVTDVINHGIDMFQNMIPIPTDWYK